MLTATQIRLHQQALTILSRSESLLELMQEYKKAREEAQTPESKARYRSFYDACQAKRMKIFEEYSELLKQIIAPFEKDLFTEETPAERESAVQLAESFYSVPPDNVIPWKY